jgi:hypothetical protein
VGRTGDAVAAELRSSDPVEKVDKPTQGARLIRDAFALRNTKPQSLLLSLWNCAVQGGAGLFSTDLALADLRSSAPRGKLKTPSIVIGQATPESRAVDGAASFGRGFFPLIVPEQRREPALTVRLKEAAPAPRILAGAAATARLQPRCEAGANRPHRLPFRPG